MKRFFFALLLLAEQPAFWPNLGGRSSSDVFVLPPHRYCVGEDNGGDNGQNVCMAQSGNGQVKVTSAVTVPDFIAKNTLDLTINDKNTGTSGGEKQKISILKVLMKDPTVMIFDEPTSALDRQTSVKFMEYLCQIKKDKIIILITHDNHAIGLCDEVVDMVTHT